MKKCFLLLATLLVVGSTVSQARGTAPTPAATSQAAELTPYEVGLADGRAYAADLAAAYGYGTPEYQDALATAQAQAQYNATHSDEPTYWRGYRYGLASY